MLLIASDVQIGEDLRAEPLLIHPLFDILDPSYDRVVRRAQALESELRHIGFPVKSVFCEPSVWSNWTGMSSLAKDSYGTLLRIEDGRLFRWSVEVPDYIRLRGGPDAVRFASEAVISCLGAFQK